MITNTITYIGLSLLFLYSFTQIMNYYGVSTDSYFDYILYYIFIMVTILVLPNDYPLV